MTKERLEELIKQGAKVFYVNAYRTVMELEFKNKIYAHNDFYLWYGKIPYEIRTLYETKKQAEWHLKTYAERTERFEPPMWDEIEEHFGCIDYKFAFVKNNEIYTFTVGKDGAVDITKLRIYGLGFHPVYTADPTKENYEKACEMVRDLFKGEK